MEESRYAVYDKAMRKYLAIIKTYWQRALTYRATVISYRVGEIGEALVLILMWTAIYGDGQTISGFTLREMVTYILVGNFFAVHGRGNPSVFFISHFPLFLPLKALYYIQ